MEFSKAKQIFTLSRTYTQKEIDSFYNYEKGLLLEKLSSGGSVEELDEAQKTLSELERAYSILSIKYTEQKKLEEGDTSEPSHYDSVMESNSQHIKKSILISFLVLFIAIGAFGFIHISTKDTAPAPRKNLADTNKTNTTPLTESTKVAPAQKNVQTEKETSRESAQAPQTPVAKAATETKRVSENVIATIPVKPSEIINRSTKNNKEIVTLLILQLDKLDRQWQPYAERGYQINEKARFHREQGYKYYDQGNFSQAIFHFDEAELQYNRSFGLMAQYRDVFIQHENLKSQWNALASKNKFSFVEKKNLDEKFSAAAASLKLGKQPEIPVATLEAVCFRYNEVLKMGQSINDQNQRYLNLKRRWSQISGDPKTLTPSIQGLMKEAEKTIITTKFEYFDREVFPRLINHFERFSR